MTSIDIPSGTVAVQVTPKSSKNQIEGWFEDAAGKRWLRVRLTAAPEDGKANAALIKLLAKEWGIAASRISIESGHAGRKKLLQVR